MLERLNKSFYDWNSPSHDKCIVYRLAIMHYLLSASSRKNQVHRFKVITRCIKNNI